MTAGERALLREVFRWARADGVRLDGAVRWMSPPPHRWGVEWWGGVDDEGEGPMVIWREGKTTGKQYWVASVTEAVDVLCAFGILPPRFSSAYRAGWDASRTYGFGAHCGAEYRAIVPAVKREVVWP